MAQRHISLSLNSPLSFQEGFEIDTNLKFYFHLSIEN
jgi:hypothetical protein